MIVNCSVPEFFLKSVTNFRGLGGLKAADGSCIAFNRLFRSPALTAADTQQLEALGVGLVCDLRSPTERDESPQVWSANTPKHILPPYDQRLRAIQRNAWQQYLLDPSFDEAQAKAVLTRAYCSMPRTLTKVLADLFSHCETAEPSTVFINCAHGKDRTGFVVALLLFALDLPPDAIMDNYLLSNAADQPRQSAAKILSSVYPQGAPERAQKAAEVIFSVSQDVLTSVLNKLKNDYGSIDNYLVKAAGLTSSRKIALKAYFCG